LIATDPPGLAVAMPDAREAAAEGPSDVAVSENRLLGGRVRLRQPVTGYRAAIDPVLLAATVPATAGERVLDVGSGPGAAGLCLAARVPGVRLTLLEADVHAAERARENAALAAADPPIAVVEADVAAAPCGLGRAVFDHVLTNPPFMEPERGTPATARGRSARHEGGVPLADWIRACVLWVRAGGTVTVVHRADRCDQLIAAMVAAGLGGIAVLPLWPRAGEPAKRLIVQGRRGSRARARLLPGLVLHGDVLHGETGTFTAAADAVLRGATALPL